MGIQRRIDVPNLVKELAENKVDALELIREALSNSKDHGAKRVWIRTFKEDPRSRPSVLLIDDGEGMTDAMLSAFWGVGASQKSKNAIGYKGHGTKLYFACKRLTVATKTKELNTWRLFSAELPAEMPGDKDIPEEGLAADTHIYKELKAINALEGTGTAILIEQLEFNDVDSLLQRRRLESYCDWFTVIGDVRSGLFDERLEFHQAIATGDKILEALRLHESDLRPIDVRLRINGEKEYTPPGLGPTPQDKQFFEPWPKDVSAFKEQPGVLSLGHRFSDKNESTWGTARARDDLTALRLTSPHDWVSDEGYAMVARVEGHRRQRETYLEAKWQNKKGLYGFEERFGLWLCRDFIPIARRNDLLQDALNRASKRPLQFELGNLRNWQIFINHQGFLPTANRNDISNLSDHSEQVVKLLAALLEKKLKEESFREWVSRLRAAKLSGQRDREVTEMDERREGVRKWIEGKRGDDGVDPVGIAGLELLDPEESLLMRSPTSEQELFYLYGLLSGRYKMPLHVLEYDATQGVDAIALLRSPSLISPKTTHVRVEFKYEVAAQNPIDHFFQAIDVIVCWKVGRVGTIYEQTSDDTTGQLKRRVNSILNPPIDTHEITYQDSGATRIIPVLEIFSLFGKKEKKSPSRKKGSS